jgi:hypothetical protein
VGNRELLRRIGQKHAQGANRAEWDDLELHQPSLAERKLAQQLQSLLRIGDIHHEHDAALVLLEVPLVDFPSEIQPYGVAHLRREQRFPLVRRPLGREGTDRQQFGRWDIEAR